MSLGAGGPHVYWALTRTNAITWSGSHRSGDDTPPEQTHRTRSVVPCAKCPSRWSKMRLFQNNCQQEVCFELVHMRILPCFLPLFVELLLTL